MTWVWSLNPMWQERIDSCRLSLNYHTCTGAPAWCRCQTYDKDFVSSHHAQSWIICLKTLGALLRSQAWEHTDGCTHPGLQACTSPSRVRQGSTRSLPAAVSHSAELEGEQRTSQTLSNATSLNTQMWKWHCRTLNSCEVWQLMEESLACNYFEIDDNIVITLRLINTPQDYDEHNLMQRLHEWLPKWVSHKQRETTLNEFCDSKKKMLKKMLNGCEVTVEDWISFSTNAYAEGCLQDIVSGGRTQRATQVFKVGVLI